MDEQQGRMTSRRRFLGTAAGATGVALGAAVWGKSDAAAAVISQGAAQPLMADKRGYVAGKFMLDIGENSAGWIEDTEGGGATSDVVNEKLGADHIVHKHIAGVKYEDITVRAGAGMSKGFYDWISASWSSNFARHDGAIHATNFNNDVVQTRKFYNALITETTMPACDASSKEPAFLTLRFAPEYTRTAKGSGKAQADATKQQKMWSPANFKLEIDGLDCSRVNKIEAITVKQKVVENPIGEDRDYNKEPASVEFPNLTVTFGAQSGQSWTDWFQDFVIDGRSTGESEKTGSLTYLTPNLQGALFRLNFFGLGIFRLEDGVFDPVNEPSATMRAHLYVERIAFQFLGGATPPTPSPTPTNGP